MFQEAQIQDKKSPNNRVKVAIRIRPLVDRQILNGDTSCIQIVSDTQIILANEKLFRFDQVLDQNSQQQQVYDRCVGSLVSKCFQGYNAAILAYGQTGSGKTFTMGTSSSKKISKQQIGILPRVIQNIFSMVMSSPGHFKYIIKASFIQIYNQQIIDLLCDVSKPAKQNLLSIREQKDGSVSIYGANQQQVLDSDDMLQLLDKGSFHRTTSSTLMNDASSRSHAIFTITIQRNSREIADTGVDQNYVTSKFVFVDLAGSERIKKTGATGNTLKEGININLGLLELGNVISSLAIQKKDSKFINFRNSKLTRILQNSLGGNSNTFMIACVSPAQSNYEQSLNSIKYASKAMNIKNKPVINRDPQQAHILKLKGIIEQYQKQNIQLKRVLNQKGISLNINNIVSGSCYSQSEQINRLKTRNSILQKKCQSLLLQAKQQKKRCNQTQILLYQSRRQKDLLTLRLQSLQKGQIPQQSSTTLPLIQSYLNKIQYLQSQLHQKQKSISLLQIQYNKIYQSCQRDSILLGKKNQRIDFLESKIKHYESRLYKDQGHGFFGSQGQIVEHYQHHNDQHHQHYQHHYDQQLQSRISRRFQQIQSESCIDQRQSQAHLQQDLQFNSQFSNHAQQKYKLSSEMKFVDKNIKQTQAVYAQINEKQINLQYKLIQDMKNQYHQKIIQLQRQRQKLLRKDNGNNKNVIKTQNLQVQIRELKRKAKQQKNLQKQVNVQGNKLRQLGSQINNFRMQKIQLSRKMKEQKDKFNKFKSKRIKQLIFVKKQNNKKDFQIRKLKNDNKKQVQNAIKRKQQIKRIKKVNQTLKVLMKPQKINRGTVSKIQIQSMASSRMLSKSVHTSSKNSINQPQQINESQYDILISDSLRSILHQIQRSIQSQRLEQKCKSIEQQIQTLKQQQSLLNIKIQRLLIKFQGRDIYRDNHNYKDLEQEQDEKEQLQLAKIRMHDVKERLLNLEDNYQFHSQRYDNLDKHNDDPKYKFNYQTQIIYNKKYQNNESFRALLTCLFQSITKAFIQNINLKQQSQSLLYQRSSLQTQTQLLKDQILQKDIEYQQNLSKLREQIMQKYYQDMQRDNICEIQNLSFNQGKIFQNTTYHKRHQDQIRKKFQKKIDQLNKMNKALVKQLQVQRKKCQIVSDKYTNLKSLLNKDKFIGITAKQQDHHSLLINPIQQIYPIRQKRNQSTSKPSYQNVQKCQIEQMQQILFSQKQAPYQARKRKYPQVIKQSYPYAQSSQSELSNIQFTRNNWQLLLQIPSAHKSPILSLAHYQNLLISSASKSIMLWDLQNNQLVRQIGGGVNTTFVRSVVIHPERQVIFSTNDRLVNVWDFRTHKVQMTLKAHKDQIRTMHVNGDYLFSAGKGTVNGGALLVWDLRGSLSFSVIGEKEKNQDIFSMTSQDGVLYYGTRDHFVRRMKIQNNDTMLAFQPPHMDTVTGLTIVGDYLISGSKDKNLRLWSLNSSMYNLRSTVHSFNQYITAVESDGQLPIFYASDRSGQVKIGCVINQKIQFLGGILAHSQQINSICKIKMNPHRGIFATGSSDKSIKLWQPSHQTLNHISNDF